MNRQAARQQADGAKDRKIEHLLWRGARYTLAQVKDVGDHENSEDGRLSGDQTKHSHSAARGKNKFRVSRWPWDGYSAQASSPVYSYFQSGSSGCLISQSGRRLLTTGILAKLYSSGGELTDHSRVHASQGSFPALAPFQ